MDSASGAPAVCLPREKCAPIEEWRLQAQYWLKFISIFQRQQRVCLVQTTGWKQYLVASRGWAERCVNKTVHGKSGKGENQILPSKSQRRQITPQPEGAALAQEICFVCLPVELGNQPWDSWELLSSGEREAADPWDTWGSFLLINEGRASCSFPCTLGEGTA